MILKLSKISWDDHRSLDEFGGFWFWMIFGPGHWIPILFPYHSQSRIPKDIGIVWVQFTIRECHVLGSPWNHR